VSLGVGIGGTFVALFASGWKYGYLYPWLIPLRVLHEDSTKFWIALLVGSAGGIIILAATLYDSIRRDVSYS